MSHPFAFFYRYLLTAYPFFEGCGPCKARPPALRERRTALVASFPVDIVYTWVDGRDEQWAARRDATLPEKHLHCALEQGNALYADNEELRYSLRSIERYVPWVRNIYLVTDGQSPAWLTSANPKIHIVDHKDIIPPEYLPTFNSHVIEAYLHRIPGLAEHYIYCNDDFFFSSPSTPEDFFTPNGLPHIFMDWRYSRRNGYERADTPHACSYANTREFLKKKGICPDQEIIVAHVPYAQSKKNAQQAFAFFEEPIRAFSTDRFRNKKQMAFYCHCLPYWSFALKRAVPVDTPFFYINTVRFDRQIYYSAILREKDSGLLPLFFCLNDVGEALRGDTRHKDMRAFLEAFFPCPSSFEV